MKHEVETIQLAMMHHFTGQLLLEMEQRGVTLEELAKRMKVSKSHAAQLLKTTGNLTVKSIARLAKALDLFVTLVPHHEDDSDGLWPVHPQAFLDCWEHMEKPKSNWETDHV
jgi:transcriptional regulator with XRE-family HTH domain